MSSICIIFVPMINIQNQIRTMKKSIFTLLLMLATMSMTAQTIDGTWAADEAFRKEMGLDKEEPAMNLMISFDKVKTKKSTKSGEFCVAMPAVGNDDEIGTIGVNFLFLVRLIWLTITYRPSATRTTYKLRLPSWSRKMPR